MIFCTGELLADITESADGRHARAGGAPFNVACNVLALGGESGFYGCVGKDALGDMLASVAYGCGISARVIRSDLPTAAAYIRIDGSGERSFSFKADGTADTMLDECELASLLPERGILHLGSLMLRTERGRGYARRAAALARGRGLRVSFDVNLRSGLYRTESDAVAASLETVGYADIVKLSEEEAELLTGEKDARAAAETLSAGGKTVFVTLGGDGAVAAREGAFVRAPAHAVEAVDTTGAGDAFFAAALLSLHDGKSLRAALEAGCDAGARAVSVRSSSLLRPDN